MNDSKQIPRVAAVHDISGFGKCALTVALPVISACGVEVCPLPTAVLSSNTHYSGFTFYDYTPHMEGHLRHWKELGLTFDALYSGFLGSAEQIDTVIEVAKRFSPPLTVIDPVMGDNGEIYKTYTPEMCQRMRELAAIADVITPNLTEACVLSDMPYNSEQVSASDIETMARKIAALGAKSVVITGVEREDQLLNCSLDERGYHEQQFPLLPFRIHGTGDLFASVLTGAMIRGHKLRDSIDSAARFVAYVMEKSKDVEDIARRGACFEPYLYCLRGGIFSKPDEK